MKKTKFLVALSVALSVTCIGGINPAFAAEKEETKESPKEDQKLDVDEILDNFKDLDEDSFFSDIDEDEGKIFVSGTLSDFDFSGDDEIFDFIKENESLFNCEDIADKLKIEKKEEDDLGYTHVLLSQTIEDLPIENKSVMLHFNDEGEVINVTADVETDIDSLTQLGNKNITTSAAVEIAENQFDYDELAYEPPVERVAYIKNGEAYDTFKVNIKFYKPEITNCDVYIEATSGKVLKKDDRIRYDGSVSGTGIALDGTTKKLNMYEENGEYELKDVTRNTKSSDDTDDDDWGNWFPWFPWGSQLDSEGYFTQDGDEQSFSSQSYGSDSSSVDNSILTYSANNREVEPGSIVTNESASISDDSKKAAVSAHYYADVVYDFYNNLFDRKSLDNKGMNLVSTVHYGNKYNNAFWDGSQMVYGDGDGKQFSAFSGDLDVVGHEMTHGLTSCTADLNYQGQSGALNESMSDVMGVLIQTYDKYNVKDGGDWKFNSSDWVVGDEIYTPGVDGDALRSLKDPTLYNQPDNMDNYYNTSSDNGGVHTNSGIPNKAAYLVAKKIGNEKTARIYYRGLTNYMTKTTNFKGARDALMQAASDLYGANSSETTAISDAFESVGVE